MKNFISRFLGLNNNQVTQPIPAHTSTMNSEMANEMNIPENLFTDKNSPATVAEEVKKSGVKLFLEEKHHDNGLLDGYNYHSTEVLNNHINSMASSFRHLLEVEIKKTDGEITELNMHVASIGQQFNDLYTQLNVKIDEKIKFIMDYKEQIVKSIELEGWIGSPVAEYKKGFHKGVAAYLKEKGLLETYQIL